MCNEEDIVSRYLPTYTPHVNVEHKEITDL